jgi:predicted GIY-YIG superfamily endonuclease
MGEHKHGTGSIFASQYKLDRLVYFESFDDVLNAIDREKQLKGLLRSKKIAPIVSKNPAWRDLSEDWFRELQRDTEVHRSLAAFGVRLTCSRMTPFKRNNIVIQARKRTLARRVAQSLMVLLRVGE